MISQDAMIRSAWHDSQMAEARKKVLDAMNYNLGHGYRLMHPGFRGLPDNSTGSKNRPFFAMKDEVDCPLEAKVQARGGGNPGALWNPAGRKYAKQILQRRAVDTSALEEGMEAPQVVPPFAEEPSLEKKLQFNLSLQQLSQAITSGNYSDLTADLVRRVIGTSIGIIPFMDEDEVINIYRTFTRMQQAVVEDQGDDESVADRRVIGFQNSFRDIADGFTKVLEEYLKQVEGRFIGPKQKATARVSALRLGKQTNLTQTYDAEEKNTILRSLVKKYMKENIFKGIKAAIEESKEGTAEEEFAASFEGGPDVIEDLEAIRQLLMDERIGTQDAIADAAELASNRLGIEIPVSARMRTKDQFIEQLKEAFEEATGYRLNVAKVPATRGRKAGLLFKIVR